MILKKDKTDDNIMFIDASREFDKERNQNVLTDENIKKIVETYKKRENVDKYAHLASLAEIKENDYNLNIPRYVDTFEPEPPVDVDKLVKHMKETDTEIERLNGEIGSMLDELVGADTDAQQQLDKIKELFK